MTRLQDRYRRPALWATFLGALAGSLWLTGFAPASLRDWQNATIFVKEMFPPDWSILPGVVMVMGETLGIAFLGTLFPFLMAFPLSFVTARNTGHRWAGLLLRALMAFLRSVPEIIWAIIFVVAVGFGNGAGILALTAHNVGILAKLIGEVIEEAPTGTQEAIASTGAPRSSVVWFGILPWAMPSILSHTFFRLECNIRTAAILGVVGAGGIGRELMLHRQLFEYQKMSVDIIGILVLVILADGLGALVRKQVA